ncbi:YcnI family protein [Microbacterium horticulturae]|uniref:YcnI family protein n=1 Tax=Microbacterium horticulturae TaxID=3028316 RepID=A0ABY8C1D7_9MICO|nr:YcnI family protein [Microbacterium sp. KACC 23027]WEG08653.1 YcnI family protein [Microbacterium sp. KACC 23027]
MTASTPRRRRGGILGGMLAAAALIVAVAAPASAHVRVDGDATAGGYAVLTFRVPTESETASTTQLKVTFPEDTPITSVSTQPKAGWTAHVSTADLATPEKDAHGNELTAYVTSVTWTATGTGIKPGEFDTFAVSVGPIPDVDVLTFPAAQTYSDGTVVKWDERAQGDAEPAHPAPTLTVAPAATTETAAADPTPAANGGSSIGLGVTGIVTGALGLVLAVIALVRSGRRKDPDAP